MPVHPYTPPSPRPAVVPTKRYLPRDRLECYVWTRFAIMRASCMRARCIVMSPRYLNYSRPRRARHSRIRLYVYVYAPRAIVLPRNRFFARARAFSLAPPLDTLDAPRSFPRSVLRFRILAGQDRARPASLTEIPFARLHARSRESNASDEATRNSRRDCDGIASAEDPANANACPHAQLADSRADSCAWCHNRVLRGLRLQIGKSLRYGC